MNHFRNAQVVYNMQWKIDIVFKIDACTVYFFYKIVFCNSYPIEDSKLTATETWIQGESGSVLFQYVDHSNPSENDAVQELIHQETPLTLWVCVCVCVCPHP